MKFSASLILVTTRYLFQVEPEKQGYTAVLLYIMKKGSRFVLI